MRIVRHYPRSLLYSGAVMAMIVVMNVASAVGR